MKKIVALVILFSALLGLLFWQYSTGIFNKSKKDDGPVTLNFWTVTQDETILRPIITAFENSHPNIKVQLNKQSLLNYRSRVQTQIRAGQGADIFEIHQSWIPMFSADLAGVSKDELNFKKNFYPVFEQTLSSSGRVYALPIGIDGLVMYYNEEILKGAGIVVPKTWQEFIESAKKVTVKNQDGQIQTAGASMGTTTNVDFWPEIIALLFLQQPGSDLAAPAGTKGAEVLQFYTSFITDPRIKTWDITLPPSGKMFAEGKLAFYFAPIRKAQEIKDANPTLPFKTAPVPQLPGKNTTYGTFWVETVSARSKYQEEAWEFLKFLTSTDVLQAIYQQQTENGKIGNPFPRPEMAGLLINDPILGTIIAQAPYYKTWYLNSDTQDGGINEEMVNLYQGAINNVLQGQDPQAVLQVIQPQIQQVLGKYIKK